MPRRGGFGWLVLGGVLVAAAWAMWEPAPPGSLDVDAPAITPEARPLEAPIAPQASESSATPVANPGANQAPSEHEGPTPEGPHARPPIRGCDGEERIPLAPPISEPVNVLQAELVDRTRHLASLDDGPSDALRSGLRQLFGGDDPQAALDALWSAPDRKDTGFDHWLAALAWLAARDLGDGDLAGAAHWGALASRGASDEALGPLLEALVAERRGENERAHQLLEEAASLAPHSPSLTFEAGLRSSRTGDLDAADEALGHYLRLSPDDAAARTLAEKVRDRRALTSGYDRIERRGIRVVATRTLPEEARNAVLDGVEDALRDAARLLGTPRRPSLTVFVYPDREALREATCGPSWSGGLFDGALHLEAASLREPSRRRELIRHEALHAQLRRDAPTAPLWLHEGLAQRFSDEWSPGHERSFEILRRDRTYVPFASMEGEFIVIDDASAARLAYHQSLAMVEWLAEQEGEGVFARAVALLTRGVSPGALLDELSHPPLDGATLLEWLDGRRHRRP